MKCATMPVPKSCSNDWDFFVGGRANEEFKLGDYYANEQNEGSYLCSKEHGFENPDGGSLSMGQINFEIGSNLDEERFGEGTGCSGDASTATISLLTLISFLFLTVKLN